LQHNENLLSPLERRIFKAKNPSMTFLCPLCRTERAFHYRPRLSVLNYGQIVLLTVATIWLTFPIFQWKSFFFFFIYWTVFEAMVRLLFRKEIPCPHCGFDASWYKRDVKVARKKVEEFWQGRPQTNSGSEEIFEQENVKVDANSNAVLDANSGANGVGESTLTEEASKLQETSFEEDSLPETFPDPSDLAEQLAGDAAVGQEG